MATFTSASLGYVGSQAFPGMPGSSIRGIYETSTPTTQCNNTIGKFVNGIECYICGMPIVQQNLSLGINGLNPECEHILPIAQAILFLGLYGDKFNKNRLFYNPDQFKLEYAWAHRTCNQIKSDESYIKYNDTTKKFAVDTVLLRSFLTKIWINKRSDSLFFNSELKTTYGVKDTFLSTRMEPLTGRFQIIADYLNSFNSPELILLIGAVKALEGPMSEEGARFVGSVNSAAQNDKRIKEVKESLELGYDRILQNVISQLRPQGLINESHTKYKNFLQEANRYKPFYVALYIKLGDSSLQSNWEEYVKTKLLLLFYQVYVDEPLAINALLKLSKNTPNRSILNTIKSRRMDLLAKQIGKLTLEPTYQSIQLRENSLTNSTTFNFEEVARGAISMGTFPKRVMRGINLAAAKERRTQKAQKIRKNKREQALNEKRKATYKATLNNTINMAGANSGGYRKTRKNRHN